MSTSTENTPRKNASGGAANDRQSGALQSPVAPADERAALSNLYRAYVNLLEAGRDRIIDLGGQCDPVLVMERSDPALIEARACLADAHTVSGYVCAECKAALRPGYTCDVCFSDEPYDGERQIPVYLDAPTPPGSAADALPGDWKLIATAPEDGRTLLLGYYNRAGKWRTVRGQWMSEAYIAENWEDPEDSKPGWFETSVEADDPPNCWAIDPTHWMPIPSAPTQDIGATDALADPAA